MVLKIDAEKLDSNSRNLRVGIYDDGIEILKFNKVFDINSDYALVFNNTLADNKIHSSQFGLISTYLNEKIDTIVFRKSKNEVPIGLINAIMEQIKPLNLEVKFD